jgi:hypothetical protein
MILLRSIARFGVNLAALSAVVTIGCSLSSEPIADEIAVDAFRIGGHIFRLDSIVQVALVGPTDTSITIGVGGFLESSATFDGYEKTTWSIEEFPDALPSFLTIAFQPAALGDSVSQTIMRIRATAPLAPGTYRVTIRTDHALFNLPKTIRMYVSVAAPVSAISVSMSPDSLYIAPGTTESTTLTVSGIKAGEQYALRWSVPFSAPPASGYVHASDTLFDASHPSATLTFSIPATLLTGAEGANLYIANRLTGELTQFGFAYIRTGFVANNPSQAQFNIAVGDTLDIPLTYNITGKGIFSPRLDPPAATPPIDVHVLQDITSVSAAGSVTVHYRVVFPTRPVSGYLEFQSTGSITHGRTDTKTVSINVN